MKNDITTLTANTIRLLAADAIQKANSGHPGMPMGMADVATILWTEYLIHNPSKPDWFLRDRFVLSAGHGSTLLYALLHLSGYELSIEELKSFRQWGSRTAGHPEFGVIPGIETTTGPLGQGFANAVGMGIASKLLASRFATSNEKVFRRNKVYAIVSDGDLMEGISHEAASIAGHLQLENLIFFYDDNNITIEGNTSLAFSENIKLRFESYNWNVLETDAYNHDSIRSVIKSAQCESSKPTLIICKSKIGFGSPNKVNTSEVHGAPLGEEELQLTKENLGFDCNQQFFIPDEVKNYFQKRKIQLEDVYGVWYDEFSLWEKSNTDDAELLRKYLNNFYPENIEDELLIAAGSEANATRSISGKVIQKIAELIPNFIGGSADLAPSTNTFMKKYKAIFPNDFSGKNFHFGIREHAMGAIMNGIAAYGGFRVFGATFFVFSDYMRPAIRLASIMHLPVVYVFTHDSIFVGEDGPTHQPVEHLAALRLIPGVTIFRPADPVETAMAWSYAVKNDKNPVALLLTRQKTGVLGQERKPQKDEILKGAYIVEDCESPQVVIAASGSELFPVLEAKKLLENKYAVRVVSIPSLELFNSQSEDYKKSLFPTDVPVVVVEAALMNGWGDIFRQKLLKIGLNKFGASGPYQTLAEKYGLIGSSIAQKVKDFIS
ncbi:MAG: transketolase [Ignavibacteriaceae bacterium]|nr:transketolase [Ignavibacteriaceae bacterium]